MRCIRIMVVLLASTPIFAAEVKIQRNIPYSQPPDAQRRLDVYAPAEGNNHPIAIWIHGGGWRQGDKAGVQQKPAALVEKGFVFVSLNYRFVPDVSVKEMAADVAKAIKWVKDHAAEHGGASDKIFVMGHSAGDISLPWSAPTTGTSRPRACRCPTSPGACPSIQPPTTSPVRSTALAPCVDQPTHPSLVGTRRLKENFLRFTMWQKTKEFRRS